MSPFGRSRLWLRIGSVVMMLAAAALVLVPLTAAYVTDNAPTSGDSQPRQVSALYSWWTTDEVLVYSDSDVGSPTHAVKGVRLDCGNLITSGANESQLAASGGPTACSAVSKPRHIIGLVLLVLGAAGFLMARRLPVAATKAHTGYRKPYSQRRALRRYR